MFDREESPKTALRQWQHVLELETYIIYVRGISYVGGVSYVQDIFGRRGDKLWNTQLGEKII